MFYIYHWKNVGIRVFYAVSTCKFTTKNVAALLVLIYSELARVMIFGLNKSLAFLQSKGH